MEPFYQPPVAIKTSRFSRRTTLIVAGVAAAIIVAIILMILSSGGNKNAEGYARAVARQEALLGLIEDAEDDITNPEVSKISIDAELYVSSDLASFEVEIPKFGLKGVPEDIALAEADTTSEAKLEAALVQNRFDEIYLELLTEKIDAQRGLLGQLYAQLPASTPKEKVKAAYEKLGTLQSSLEKLKN